MIKVRKEILKVVRKNKERQNANTFYTELLTDILTDKGDVAATKANTDQMENILDIR